MEEIMRHILEKAGGTDLLHTLVHRLSAAELNTLLLEVYDQRVAAQQPAELLSKYGANRLVKPANIAVLRQKEEELRAYHVLAATGFEPLELSPVAQLGTSATVAPVHQKKVLTALRNTEVSSDPTNALALHYAHLKKTGAPEIPPHYCNISRALRTQALHNPAHSPHFSVCAMASFGQAAGKAAFEQQALQQHLSAQEKICREVYGITTLRLEVIPQQGYTATHPFITAALQGISAAIPVSFREAVAGKSYYYGFQVKVMADVRGEMMEVGDGGPVNWTQQLLQDKKERMFISGLGLQLLHYVAQVS